MLGISLMSFTMTKFERVPTGVSLLDFEIASSSMSYSTITYIWIQFLIWLILIFRYSESISYDQLKTVYFEDDWLVVTKTRIPFT